MGLIHWTLLSQPARKTIIDEIATLVLPKAPFFTPTMKDGKTQFRYQMTNMGQLGWVSDSKGYRYTDLNPYTKNPWPPLIPSLMTLIEFLKLQDYLPRSFSPETCLINKYLPGQSLGLHQDNTEKNLTAPILSVSIGAAGIFLLGGTHRSAPVEEIVLQNGDILILDGEDRKRFHGFKGVLGEKKRLNLTVRQVHPFSEQ